MGKAKKRRQATGKPRGKPSKKGQAPRRGAGRKLKQCGEVMSASTEWRRAQIVRRYVGGNSRILDKAMISTNIENGVPKTPKDQIPKRDQQRNELKRHSPDTAAAFYLENNYSKKKYCGLVTDSRDHGAKIYPSYDYMQPALVECRPDGIIADDLGASVPMQSMGNKTVERTFEEVALEWPPSALRRSKITLTVGMDSSSRHLNPQQKYSNNPGEESRKADQSLFVTSMNLVMIEGVADDGTKYEWTHPKPQSRRIVRPLRIRFETENDETTRKEYDRLCGEIDALVNHEFTLSNGKTVNCKFDVRKTLLDGKCVNAITGNKCAKRCVICGRMNDKFNNVDDNFPPVDEERLDFGLGLLHVVIKVFEYLLHLAYKNDPNLRVWRITAALKGDYLTSETKFKDRMWRDFRVRVDQVLAGKGTCNTGKIAFWCLMQPKKLAETLELDEDFVTDLSDSVRLFRSQKRLKYDELEIFMRELHRRHFVLYPWAHMSPTLHRYLWHACEIARRFPLPMIYFAEDGSESSNKNYRKDMVEHARQCDRTSRIVDVFTRAVDISDPKFSLMTLKKAEKKKKKVYTFNSQMKKYLHESESLECCNEEFAEIDQMMRQSPSG